MTESSKQNTASPVSTGTSTKKKSTTINGEFVDLEIVSQEILENAIGDLKKAVSLLEGSLRIMMQQGTILHCCAEEIKRLKQKVKDLNS